MHHHQQNSQQSWPWSFAGPTKKRRICQTQGVKGKSSEHHATQLLQLSPCIGILQYPYTYTACSPICVINFSLFEYRVLLGLDATPGPFPMAVVFDDRCRVWDPWGHAVQVQVRALSSKTAKSKTEWKRYQELCTPAKSHAHQKRRNYNVDMHSLNQCSSPVGESRVTQQACIWLVATAVYCGLQNLQPLQCLHIWTLWSFVDNNIPP